MADDTPRQNDRLLNMVEKTYDLALLVGDDGMWTVFETIKLPIAQAPSQQTANRLIKLLEARDGKD